MMTHRRSSRSGEEEFEGVAGEYWGGSVLRPGGEAGVRGVRADRVDGIQERETQRKS